jgi:biopolymer transport protein ExbD
LVHPVNIQISADGSLYWNQEAFSMSELPARIVAYKAQEKDPKVFISGDEKARFGTTVLVLDELRKADIKKFSIETKPRPTGK